jgi:hypothetical protein
LRKIDFISAATTTAVVSLRWNSTGQTVAGITSSPGTAANQLWSPYSVLWRPPGVLYIVEYNNARVSKWIIGTQNGTTLAGQASGVPGNDSSHLYLPTSVLVDSNDNLYVADRANERIQYWPNGISTGVTIIGTTGMKQINAC